MIVDASVQDAQNDKSLQDFLAHVQGLPLPTDSAVSALTVGADSPAGSPVGKQPLPIAEMVEKMARTRARREKGSSSGNGGGAYVPPSRRSGGGSNFGGSMSDSKKLQGIPFILVGLLVMILVALAGQGVNSLFLDINLEAQAKANQMALQELEIESRKAKLQAEIEAAKNGRGLGTTVVAQEKKVETFPCDTPELRDQGFANASIQEISSPGDYSVSSGCALVRFPGSLTVKKVTGDGKVYTEDATSSTGFRGCVQGSAGSTSVSCESFISGRYKQPLRVAPQPGRSIRFTVVK